jgi:hypothetical protein
MAAIGRKADIAGVANVRSRSHIATMKLGTLNNGNPPAPISAAWAAPQGTARAKGTGQQCRCRATRHSIERIGRPLCCLHGDAKGSGQVTPEGKRRIAQRSSGTGTSA